MEQSITRLQPILSTLETDGQPTNFLTTTFFRITTSIFRMNYECVINVYNSFDFDLNINLKNTL